MGLGGVVGEAAAVAAVQGDAISGVAVADHGQFAQVGDPEAGFFHVFADQGLFRGFGALDGAAGEFPESGPDAGGRAFLDEAQASGHEHARGHDDGNVGYGLGWTGRSRTMSRRRSRRANEASSFSRANLLCI